MQGAKKASSLGTTRVVPHVVYFPHSGKITKVRNVKSTNKFGAAVNESDYDIHDSDDQVFERQSAPVGENVPQVGPEEENGPLQPQDIEAGPLELPEIPNGPAPPQGGADQNLRYPARNIRRPPYLDDYIVNNDLDDNDLISYNVDYCCATSVYPKTYEEAIKSQDSEKWHKAMCEEIKSLNENDTYTLTHIPEGKSVVGARWVYTVKENQNGEQRYKARYVAKGYAQVPEIDYFETFSPTAKITSIRMLMQLVLDLDMEVHQMDVKTVLECTDRL